MVRALRNASANIGAKCTATIGIITAIGNTGATGMTTGVSGSVKGPGYVTRLLREYSMEGIEGLWWSIEEDLIPYNSSWPLMPIYEAQWQAR